MIFGTLILALVVAVISTILGTLGAIGAFYSSKKFKRPIHLMNQIPVVNADVVTGFSICVLLIVFFKMDKASYVPLVIGLVSLCSPFCISICDPSSKTDGSSVIRSCTRPWMFPIWSLKKGCITTVNFRDCFWIYDVDHINIR